MYEFISIDLKGLDDEISIPIYQGGSIRFFSPKQDEYIDDDYSRDVDIEELIALVENKDKFIEKACKDLLYEKQAEIEKFKKEYLIKNKKYLELLKKYEYVVNTINIVKNEEG